MKPDFSKTKFCTPKTITAIQEPEDARLRELTDELVAACINGENCVPLLFGRIEYRLESFVMEAITPATLGAMRAVAHESLNVVREYGGVPLMFDGCKLIDATMKPHPTERNSIYTEWTTDFHPAPRYTRQPGECTPLGFFEEYDLYFAPQTGLPPTLVARYGNSPAEYGTYNPGLLGVDRLSSDDMKVFCEAYERAVMLGLIPQ